MIGTLAVGSKFNGLFSHKAEAGTAVASVGAPSNATKNKPVEGS